MASGKVKTSDIIEEGLFNEPKESALAFLEVLKNIEAQLKDTVKASAKVASSKPLDSYKNVKEVEQGIQDATKAIEQLSAVEKERIKLEQKLAEVQSEQIKKNAELRVQIQEQTKANKEAAKEKLGLISLYQKESARLTELRKQYKELAVQNKENTKEGKALLKNIQELDTKLKDIDWRVGQFQRSVGNYERAVKGVSTALKGLAASTGVLLLLDGLKNIFAGTTAGSNAMEKAIAQVTVRLTVFVGVLIEAFSKIDQSAGTLGKIESFFANLSDGFKTYQERVDKALESTNKAIDTNTKYAESIVAQTNAIVKLRKEQAELQGKADDNTLSFEEQTEAGNDLLKVTEELTAKELALLQTQALAINERRKAVADASGGRAKNIALEQEYADIIEQIGDKEAELAEAKYAINKKIREDASDTAELQLDALVDGFDTQKSINERLIADETLTFEKRRAILLQTQKSGEQSFREQIAILQKFTKQKIDADKLIAEQDSIALEQQILSAGLSEALQIQLLTVIRDRKTAVQDLSEAEKQLNADETKYLQANVALQEEALKALKERGANLSKIQKTLAEKTLQQEIDNLKAKQKLLEANSPEELRIRQELNDKILQQESARIEKQKKKEQQLQQAVLAGVKQFVDKRSEAVIGGLDKQISDVQKRQDQLRELAAKGAQDAEENLALEQKKQAELEAQRERAIRNQKRLQLGLSAVETYSQKVAAGDENPLASTIVDISLLQAFIDSLPAFNSGTELVSESARPNLNSAIDSYLIRADGGERIMTGAQNSMIGKMSNQELATLAHNYQQGKLSHTDSALAEKLDQLIAIEREKPVYLGRDYDATARAITDSVRQGNRIERNRRKVGRMF